MNLEKEFNEIKLDAHIKNWLGVWEKCHEIYLKVPDSFQVLMPFAYSYLEDLIRSLTSTEYGFEAKNDRVKVNNSKSIYKTIDLAIEENKGNEKLISELEKIKKRFLHLKDTNLFDNGYNRNGIAHGFLPPYYYSEDEFESLIKDIASLSNSCVE